MAELKCDGWWEQDFYGRQPMQSLSLSFDSGVITGSGIDIVGPFTFNGTLDHGTVTMKKHFSALTFCPKREVLRYSLM